LASWLDFSNLFLQLQGYFFSSDRTTFHVEMHAQVRYTVQLEGHPSGSPAHGAAMLGI